jgi:hypothetical protein
MGYITCLFGATFPFSLQCYFGGLALQKIVQLYRPNQASETSK